MFVPFYSFLFPFRPLFGPYIVLFLAPLLSSFLSLYVPFCSLFGPFLVPFCSLFVPFLFPFCSLFVPFLFPFWSLFGPYLFPFWSPFDPFLIPFWCLFFKFLSLFGPFLAPLFVPFLSISGPFLFHFMFGVFMLHHFLLNNPLKIFMRISYIIMSLAYKKGLLKNGNKVTMYFFKGKNFLYILNFLDEW